MKKVSTATTRQSRNISGQRLTIGLDLGDRNSWYCVLDESGQIQQEQRVRTTAKALQEVFGHMPRSRIAVEIGTHSPWISRLLNALGHEVIVANARKVRLIGESRKKDDRLDAQTLARLARIDPALLYPVRHRSAQAQADLTLIRARAGLVRARTSLVNIFLKLRQERLDDARRDGGRCDPTNGEDWLEFCLGGRVGSQSGWREMMVRWANISYQDAWLSASRLT